MFAATGPRDFYPRPDAASSPAIVTLYVVTTRTRAEPVADGFTSGRAAEPSYAEFRISIPPGHVPGEIEWPKAGIADPAEDFAVVSHTILDRTAFERRVAQQAGAGGVDGVGVFVHGYNTSFQEGLFRAAQMSADTSMKGAPVLFSWPSEAKVIGYATDKEAATYSRDVLTDLLGSLTAMREVDRVMLFGHSMGGWLTMETLRQLRLSGQERVLDRLDVVLAAPDIDGDVFRAQLAAIGPLDPPMVVLVSRDDRALGVSSILQGSRPRIGALDVNLPRVQEEARRANVLMVDISTIGATDGGLNHSRYAGLAAIYPKLSAQQQAGEGGIRGAGAFVLDVVGGTLATPFNVASDILN